MRARYVHRHAPDTVLARRQYRAGLPVECSQHLPEVGILVARVEEEVHRERNAPARRRTPNCCGTWIELFDYRQRGSVAAALS